MIFAEPLPVFPQVSIVLPIRNEAAYIRPCLDRLLNQDYPSDRIEILVVDGASTDGTRDLVAQAIAEHPDRDIRLLPNPQQTVPPALNVGIRSSRGQVIVRMDGHTVPDLDYVSACVDALRESGAANAGGLIRPEGSTDFGAAVARAQSHPAGAGDAKFHYAQEPQFVETVYLGAFRREVFEFVGLFDESMVRNQDTEMNIRIAKAGGKIYLDPAIRSRYEPRGSPAALWRQYFQYGWWRVETWKRHPDSLRWRQMLPPVFVATLLLLAVLSPYSGLARVLLGAQISVYALALGAATLDVRSDLAKRRRGFVSFPAALAIMHLAWGSGFLCNAVSRGRFPYRASSPRIPRLA